MGGDRRFRPPLLIRCLDPGAERAELADARMRERLADSLSYVFSELGDELGVEPHAIRQRIAAIRTGPQSPQIFGAYYDLVIAAEAGDLASAADLAREIVDMPAAVELTVAAIQDRPPRETARYRRLFLEGEGIEAADPDDAMVAECRNRISAAFALLDRGFPAMAAEIRALLRHIVLAAGPEDPKALTFDGASSFMLWGAILFNTRGQTTVVDTAQALAHESGHNLLFGHCTDGSLIENDDDELFSSPLRTDPRPMDGIVHATFVIARMHQTLARLLEAGLLGGRDREAAERDLEVHRRNFEAGDETIRAGARLTAIGEAAIGAARAYMESAPVPAATSG